MMTSLALAGRSFLVVKEALVRLDVTDASKRPDRSVRIVPG